MTKTHHCLADGVGSVGVVDLLLDTEPIPHKQSPSPPTRLATFEEAGHGWLPHPPAPIRLVAGTSLAAAHAGAYALMHPREALERSREVIDLFVRDELIAAPRSSINVPIGATRRIATASVQLGELQAVRSGLGGTVNDIVLCAATGALRELLHKRGRCQRCARAHRTRAARAARQLARLLFAKRLFNITITNVRGSPRRLYAFGAPALELVPIVPLAADHALGIMALSYAGQLTFGLSVDRAAVPDLHILKDGILDSVRFSRPRPRLGRNPTPGANKGQRHNREHCTGSHRSKPPRSRSPGGRSGDGRAGSAEGRDGPGARENGSYPWEVILAASTAYRAIVGCSCGVRIARRSPILCLRASRSGRGRWWWIV